MRTSVTLFGLALVLGLTGCAGPEQKLGRGLRNVTEFARLGEFRRSVEQTALWDGTGQAYTTGVLRGLNRSVARTAVGVYEIVTFPFPSYDPVFAGKNQLLYPDSSIRTTKFPYGGLILSPDPVYPASYAPGLASSTLFATDTSLGFSGGDVAPMIPGSRFRIFDNN